MWCISDTKSRSAFSVTRVLIPETPGVFMLLVSLAWCSHVALIKFLSIATSLVIVNCDKVNYCQWRYNIPIRTERHEVNCKRNLVEKVYTVF